MPEILYHNFLNLPPELSDADQSRAVVLPLPVDITASWKRGTGAGPNAIILASHHIEFFDEELGARVVEAIGGIHTHPFLEFSDVPEAVFEEIRDRARELVREGRLLVSLGGEHSVTWPLVYAHKEVWDDICVLQIDAHADLREEYKNTPLNHACPMRRLMEHGVHVTALGIRSVDETEAALLNGPLRRTFLDCEYHGRIREVIPEIVASLPGKHVYVTIDVDGFDPALMPATGTPIPGGVTWHEALSLLRAVAREKTIVGADVVELMPRADLHACDSVAARLVYKIIGYSCLNR